MAFAIVLCLLAATWSSVSARARKQKDNTPFPCLEKYDDEVVKAWVDDHLKGVPKSKDPQMLLMLGGSGAGKGEFLKRWRDMERRLPDLVPIKMDTFVTHGLDEYLAYIPEYQKSIGDPAHVYKDAADSCYKGAAIPAAKIATQEILSKKLNVIYEETGKDLERIKKRVLPPFTDAGYRVTLVFVDNDPDIAIKRAAARFDLTGRYAADDYIRGTFKNTIDSFEELRGMKIVKEAIYCDNSKLLHCWSDQKRPTDAVIPKDLLSKGSPEYRWDIPKSEL